MKEKIHTSVKSKMNNAYAYNYYLKDHLGNNRIVMNASGTVVQMTNYYPSGVTMAGSDVQTNPSVQPCKFGNKELDRTNGMDFYDFEARAFDPTLMRFLSPDPLEEKYYVVSPYAYCGNNPVRYIDPTGMDWFWDEDETRQYNPNLNKDNQAEILKKGQIYIGSTDQVKDKNGKVIENYRKDGSIMFTNESSGYRRLWNNTQTTGNEEIGIITDNGILVLPSYKNDPTTSEVEEYGYSWNNGNISDADGNSFSTLGTMHTHPNPNGDGTASIEDISYFGAKTPNKPFLVLSANQQQLSTYIGLGGGNYDAVILPVYNGISPTLNGLIFGKYPLLETLKQNKRK
jgi:RHS repeat-associated protein